MTEYETHPIALIYPEVPELVEELAKSIQEIGLNHPITLFEGKILDGRHRYLACQKIGKEPSFKVRSDLKNPIEWVVAQNEIRRHLNPSQLAMVAARMANLKRGNPSGNNQYVKEGGNRPHGRFPPDDAPLITQRAAADRMGVGERSVRRAKKIMEHGTPEIVQAVDAGKMDVYAAEPIALLPKEQQGAALNFAVASPRLKPTDNGEKLSPEIEERRKFFKDPEMAEKQLEKDLRSAFKTSLRNIVERFPRDCRGKARAYLVSYVSSLTPEKVGDCLK